MLLSGIHPDGLLHCGLCVGGGGRELKQSDTMYTDTHTDLLVPEDEYHSKTMSVLTEPIHME